MNRDEICSELPESWCPVGKLSVCEAESSANISIKDENCAIALLVAKE
jgi:hypothetical protein